MPPPRRNVYDQLFNGRVRYDCTRGELKLVKWRAKILNRHQTDIALLTKLLHFGNRQNRAEALPQAASRDQRAHLEGINGDVSIVGDQKAEESGDFVALVGEKPAHETHRKSRALGIENWTTEITK